MRCPRCADGLGPGTLWCRYCHGDGCDVCDWTGGRRCPNCSGTGYIDGEDDDGGMCFIATAAYGSPTASELLAFRRFRDDALQSSLIGSVFVKLYYRVSPPVARLISMFPLLRYGARSLVLTPILLLLKMIWRDNE